MTSNAAPHITGDERRRRLARRHAVAPGHRLVSTQEAAHAVVCLHATEASTVHLAVHARCNGVTVADIDKELYQDRTLVKLLAMRRTLFAFPRDLVPAVLGAPSARVGLAHSRRTIKTVLANGLSDDGAAWLDQARRAVCEALGPGEELTIPQLRERVPFVDRKVQVSPGTKWGGKLQLAPWVVQQLQLEGVVVRGTNAGHWRLNKPLWTRADSWLGEAVAPTTEREGYAELVRRWLERFGPGTSRDIEWWMGATKTAVRQALEDVDAVSVRLDDGTGWVLPGDLAETGPVEPWAALLPVLDPTTMGWKDRDFYLDPALVPYLFDTSGNGGSTAWWDGRIVGCWVQDAAGVVRLSILNDVGAPAMRALKHEAERLTAFLDGVVIAGPYSSLQMKGARLP